MNVLLVSHGFPPQENAGTEQHVAALATQLAARGHTVSVLAATRAPGRRQYEAMEEVVGNVRVVRIVQNVPSRALSDGEQDPAIDAVARDWLKRLQPDVVAVHHLQFLSSTLPISVPTVVTLHDQWFWCAAGGLGLRSNGDVCAGPQPSICAPCASAWRPTPGRATRLLSRLAGFGARWVAPDRLHRAYQAVPHRLRPRPERGVGPRASPEEAAHRNQMMARFLHDASAVISPSVDLARRCTAATGVSVEHIPHGLQDDWWSPRTTDQRTFFLCLGTIAAHKGTDIVVKAWRTAFPNGDVPLRLHGNVQDPRLSLGHTLGGPLPPAAVRAALDGARALVMGSVWPENAPLVILEARARGCPVIAPRIGGIPELVKEGVDGWLYPAGDVLALAATIRAATLLSPRPPPRLRDQVTQVEAVLQRVTR